MKNKDYQICSRCIMDTSDPDIFFDSNGICNHCHFYDQQEKAHVLKGRAGQKKIDEYVSKIKNGTKGERYDCMIGVSGGVDSTYLLYYAKRKLGLNPLAVHFDSGWNSETAVINIENAVKKLDVDLYTYVIDWNSFKDLQLSYLKASVIDIDVPADQLIFGALFKTAYKNKIHYLITGNNVETESILPRSWYFSRKFDLRNLKAIHKKYGSEKIAKFPLLGKWRLFFYQSLYKIHYFNLLNYIGYNKKEAIKTISQELAWKDYGGKHFESIFTRFYQGYILPKKFGVDKRRAHLSNLVASKQMTRDDALQEMKEEYYPVELMEQDKAFFIKKFDLTEREFEEIMNMPIQKHEDFPMEKSVYEDFPLLKVLKPIGDLIKNI